MEEVVLSHTYRIRVRYADTDKMGIVYNGNYFTFFEIGRTELMRAHGMVYRDLEAAGYQLPLLASYAEYFSPGFYDDELDIEATLRFTYSPKLRIDYNIFRSDTTIAKGYTLHSFVKRENLRPVKPPRIFLDMIEKNKK